MSEPTNTKPEADADATNDSERTKQVETAGWTAGLSALFLVGYVAYHFVHGDTKFGGIGAIRTVYLSILASHVLLSIAVVPMVLTALYFAWRKQFSRHTKVTRILFPIWLYVSVTGVVIYFMLRGYPTAS